MALTYTYDVKRGQLGRQPMFSETRAVLCDSIAPNVLLQHQFILRNPVHRAVQHTSPQSQAKTNTPCAEYAQTGANHTEGGWPRDIAANDAEATQRYRRRIEKDDSYIHCVMNLTPSMEHYIKQNNAIDIYQTYYTELAALPKLERSDCRTVNVFHDETGHGRNRPVSSICWQPGGGRRFAVALFDVDTNRVPRASLDSYIWDIERANHPEVTLLPPCPLLDLQYNPREANVLAGGLMNGQVCSWDVRVAPLPVASCPMHVAHRDLVRNVLFINTKTGMEFFSGSADGALKWWDLRNMDEPTEELILHLVKSANEPQTMANSNGVSALEYEPTIPTRFMVGTENGLVITGNRKGKSVMDKLPGKYTAHLGPVFRVERSPGFTKNFLTVGDWTARIWSEECRESAVMWTPSHRHRITDGTWSPTRVSLMLLTQGDGVVGVWDLLRRQHEPALTVQVCEEPLLHVRMHENGQVFACGSTCGNVYLEELSPNLRESDKHDKLLLTQVIERETRAERILEARLREIRLRLRQADEHSPAGSSSASDAALGDRDLADAAAEYLTTVRKEQQAV